MKTNAVRLLDEARIPYELREHEVDPEDLAAATVAKRIGMPAEQVFQNVSKVLDDIVSSIYGLPCG
jgi:Cys-tRNA(Pro)/Cys-tRNA(Cys) deacylase